MRKVKLIQLGKYYYPVPGGMETHLYDLCTYFKDRYDLQVLVANTKAKTETEIVEGVQVTRLANLGEVFSNPICPTFPFNLHLMNGGADAIVQIHLPNPMAHLAYLFAKPVGKLIVMWHSDIVRQKRLSKLYDHQVARLLQRADCIVATSPNYIRSSEQLREFQDKCVVVPLGIRPEKFQWTPQVGRRADQIRTQYGKRLALFVGRFTYYKGLDILIRAAQQIDGKVLLIGDGPEHVLLRQMIAANGLEEKVIIKPDVDDRELAAYYHACDVFVLPSNQRSEAFGVVQLEAMVCGKPVVSTALNTGVPWVNRHGETGLIVPVNDVERLSHAVNHLLHNPDERQRLGRNARERVLRHFTVDTVSQQMARVYEQVLGGGIKPELFESVALGAIEFDELKGVR